MGIEDDSVALQIDMAAWGVLAQKEAVSRPAPADTEPAFEGAAGLDAWPGLKVPRSAREPEGIPVVKMPFCQKW